MKNIIHLWYYSVKYIGRELKADGRYNFFGSEPRKEIRKREFSFQEIESKTYFKIMLNSGCNCFLKFKTCSMIDEEETFSLFEGPKKEISDVKMQENFNNVMNTLTQKRIRYN